jgi:hypothetical protein
MNQPFNPASFVGLRSYLRMSCGSRTPLKPTARIAGTPEIRGSAIMESLAKPLPFATPVTIESS